MRTKASAGFTLQALALPLRQERSPFFLGMVLACLIVLLVMQAGFCDGESDESGPITIVALNNGGQILETKLRESGKDAPSAKPVVLDFYSESCTSCKMMQKELDKARAKYKDKVEFVAIDVNNPNNQTIVNRYQVGPVPTVIFLDDKGKVASLTIGYSGSDEVNWGLKQIVTTNKKHH